MTNVIRHFTEKLRGPGVGPVLVKGGGGALIVKVVGAGAAFVAYILLARLLGLQSFGDYVYVVGWASVLMTFGKLGFDSATIRHVAQYRAAGDEPRLQGFLRRSWQLPLAMATIVAAGFAAATWVIREQLRPELTWAMYTGAGLIVVWTALQIAASRLQAIKRVVQATVPNLVLRPLLIVVGVAILWGLVDDDIHPAAGVGVNALATFALAVLSLRWFTRSGTRPGPGVESTYETGAWLKVALPLLLIATMSRLLTRVDLLMVGSIRGTDKAAIYGAASETANLVAFGLVALIAMARPMVAELYAAGDRKRLRRTARLVALGATGIALPAFVILLVLGPWILDLFGASFSLGHTALMLLAAGQFINALCGPTGVLMTMTRHERAAAMIHAVVLALNVGLNALLIPRYGIEGAAIATMCSTVAWNIMMIVFIIRRLGINPTLLPLPMGTARSPGDDDA